MTPVIPLRSNSKRENPGFDRYLYKMRHLVENLFAKLKHYHGIAMRLDKIARNYRSMIYYACTFIWLKLK